MRDVSLWNALLGAENKTVLESVEFDQEQEQEQEQELVVARVRPTSRARGRCGLCGRRCPGYDGGEGRRRWRHTYAFDDTVAWLTVRCSKTAVRELMRVAWRTVGSIITRVS